MDVKITAIQKLNVLKKAKELCMERGSKYMCWCIQDAYEYITGREIPITYIPILFPSFTRENATMICEKYFLNLPNKVGSAWWSGYVQIERIRFFDWLIEDYSKTYMHNLPTEAIIEILEMTKVKIKKSSGFDKFICNNILYSLKDYYEKVFGDEKIFDYDYISQFKLFTVENAIEVCKKYKLKLPEKNTTAWWNSNVEKSRLAVVNWLIKEYKKQLEQES